MPQRVYLDYAASTPVDPRVAQAMQPYFTEKFGNPGSLHSFGQEAIAAVDTAREIIAKHLGVEFREIIFSGSATEANGLALQGPLGAARLLEFPRGKKPQVIVSAIEHESVLESARAAQEAGTEVVYLPVDKEGRVDPRDLKKSLNDRTVFVSVLYANNEIGTVQPIRELAEIVKNVRGGNKYPLFHTDAAQALQFLDCSANGPDALGADLMTISSHKIYGPKGIGALYVRDSVRSSKSIAAFVYGGGQEFGLRSGTENVPAIVGFAKAVELIIASRDKENKKIAALRQQLWQGIKNIFPQAEVNGFLTNGGAMNDGTMNDNTSTLPNILNVYFPGHEAQDLLTKFDLGGLAASSGSACRSRALEASYVIEAMGYSKERAKSSIRFSMGRPTTEEDIATALAILEKALRT
jgi:cysteine desulfurase